MTTEPIEDLYEQSILPPREEIIRVANGDILCEAYSGGIRIMPDENHKMACRINGNPVIEDCSGPHTIIRVIER